MQHNSQGIARIGMGKEQPLDRAPQRLTVKVEPSYVPKLPKASSRFFFHLAGEISAHDVIGQECASTDEAKAHGEFIAHRIGTEKPEMIREGNFISVRDEQDRELFQIPLASSFAGGNL
ncbi:hypothetical protein ACE103_16155 [Bradyrhizobium sp. ma5]|uniref:DUF6894 family protein n=1 Tax=Bradyrhizobium sp. ma5 TaxID=3344828 RepID=UPI0035D464D6